MRALAIACVAALALAGCSDTSGSQPTPTGPAAATAGVDDPAWRIPTAAFRGEKGIEGYANAVSVLPGQPITLFVSSPTPTYSVSAYRMSGSAPSGALRVWRATERDGARQTATSRDAATRMVAASWTPSLTVPTDGWSEGVYLFRLAATDGSASFVPVVLRSESTAGKVVLAMSATTWQAYNTWGGASTYKDESGSFRGRAYAMSFDRPLSLGQGTGKYLSYENPVVLRAERLGIPLAYVTSVDVATIPGLLTGALGYVSMGHDEYWTGSERDAVEAARDAGTNLAFLGANVSYWQVRLRSGPSGPNRVMDVYKSAAADPVKGDAATVNFRDIGRGEQRMTGQLYECFPAVGDYTVIDPGFFLFEGTGATVGSTYQRVVEVEVDRAYPLASTPRPLQVVAKTSTRCRAARTYSTSSYYTVPSGAGVFTTGTMGWVLRAMSSKAPQRSRDFVGKVTDNLLTAMAAGPMGAAHPATDNLDAMGLPRTNTTGAA